MVKIEKNLLLINIKFSYSISKFTRSSDWNSRTTVRKYRNQVVITHETKLDDHFTNEIFDENEKF